MLVYGVLMMSMRTLRIGSTKKRRKWTQCWNLSYGYEMIVKEILFSVLHFFLFWQNLMSLGSACPHHPKLWFSWIFSWKIALFCTLNSNMDISFCSFVKSNVNFNDELEPNAFNRINVWYMYNVHCTLSMSMYDIVHKNQKYSRLM